MKHIYILTYIDESDFDKVLHRSAHTSRDNAEAFAQKEVWEKLSKKVAKEWHYALEYNIQEMAIQD